MTRELVEQFFEQYAAAFSRGDVEEIGRLWMLPAFITTPNQSGCFMDADAFRKNTEALCAFYRDQGLFRAKKTIIQINQLCGGVAATRHRGVHGRRVGGDAPDC